MVETAMHCNLRPRDVQPVLLGFHYEADNAPAYTNSTLPQSNSYAHHRSCRTTASRSLVPCSRRHLSSANRQLQYLQRFATVSTLTAAVPFQSPAPTVWNSLPHFIWDPTISAECFRRLLKTYLFARYLCVRGS